MKLYLFWLAGDAVTLIFGIYAWLAKEPVRFWTVGQKIQVNSIKKYNRAVAKLWFLLTIGLAVLGLPLISGQNSAWIVVTILGTVFLSIIFMAVYTRIEKKYRGF